MIQAFSQIIISPRRAWEHLSENTTLQQYLLPLVVYPTIILTALSAYIPHFYGFITIDIATKNATLALLKYCGCVITAWVLLVLLSRTYFLNECNKHELHLFAGYSFIVTFLSVILGNILPSSFSYVQFIPAYTIWIVYQGRIFLRIPSENVFSYTVTTSTILIALPFMWDQIIKTFVH